MCSDYFLYKFLSYVFSYIISFVRHAHTYLFENEISFPPLFGQLSGGSRPSDKGGQSSRPWDNGGAVSKDFFWALRASVWSKNKGSVFFFDNGQRNLLFQKYPDTCGRGLKVWKNNHKKEFTIRKEKIRLFGQETHGRLIKKFLDCLTRLKCPGCEFRGKVLINFI